MSVIWTVGLNSLSVGAAYALIALSFTIVFNSSGVFNFAVGQFAILGGLLFVSLSEVAPPWIAALLALAIMALGGAVVYLGVLRRPEARGADPLTLVIITLGLGIIMENGAHFIWGVYAIQAPSLIPGTTQIAGLPLNWQRAAILVVAFGASLGLAAFQRRTLVGKALVAIGFSREAARLYGIDDRLITAISWAIALMLASLSGIFFGPLSSVSMGLAFPLSVKGFAAALMGGLGSGTGAIIGGFGIGVLETLMGIVSPNFTDATTFSVLLIFLLLRPAGLFGDPKTLVGPRA
jgi:branched-chain amino acid transport system permease protein